MDRLESRKKIIQRIARNGRRPGEATLLGSPIVRALLGWTAALGVLVLAVNVPINNQTAGFSWRSVHRNETINLIQQPEEILEKRHVEGGLVTTFSMLPSDEENKPQPENDLLSEDEGDEIPESTSRIAKLERIERGPILEFVDQSPAIVGGLSTLYLNIDYPAEARDQGIQGLTVLVFVVEKDGTTSDIQVMKSLHPACDSAAVVAVRNTLFKPGRQNGQIVRVKMRLPIRFKLVSPIGADTLAYRG